MSESGPNRRSVAAARFLGWASAVAGSAVLVGWAIELPILKSVLPGVVSMKPNTAVGFVLTGLALGFSGSGPRFIPVARTLAIGAGLLGVATLAEFASGANLGIDELLFREPAESVGTLAPGRMAPTTAFSFALLSVALLLLTFRKNVALAQILAWIVGLLGFLSITGYALGATELIGIGRYTQMAIHTAVLFPALSVGLLLLHADESYMRVVSGGTPGGWLLRRALFLLVGVPLLIGWLGVRGVTRGHWNPQFGIALVVLLVVVVISVLTYWAAYRLSLVESAWRQSEEAREELHRKLERSARLASLGTLVAGIAHEVNNPLTVETTGQGFALEVARDLRSRLARDAPLDRAKAIGMLEDAIEALEDAQGGGRRIADIVRDLSALARPGSARMRVRLSDVVASALDWIRPSLRDGATVDVADTGAPPVMASASQLSQVVVNLLSNAVKATPPGEKARIVVRLGAGEAGVSWIEVQDHGVGIAPDIIDRIFDPFFTTRSTGEGRGTGLGLAICHAIVTDHGGTLTVASEVGKGSAFRMELPAAPAEA